MYRPRTKIRYRKNPAPSYKLGRGRGPRVQDELSGFWTYQAYLTQDIAGNQVDPRYGSFDSPENRDDTTF